MVGWVVEQGRAHGLALPLNEHLVRQVKELEQGRRTRGLHNLDELEALRMKHYGPGIGPH